MWERFKEDFVKDFVATARLVEFFTSKSFFRSRESFKIEQRERATILNGRSFALVMLV
jgi:hypothetical protein